MSVLSEHQNRRRPLELSIFTRKGIRLDFLEWIGLRRRPVFQNAQKLGWIIGGVLGLIVIGLAVAGTAVLIQFLLLVLNRTPDHEAIRNFGLAVVAVLGTPFVVWRASVAQKQANTAEQSHITDQVNKAVDGLGAEKTVDRIGRPVTIFCGKPQEYTQPIPDTNSFELGPRSLEIKRYRDTTMTPDGEVSAGLHVDFKTWPEERTEIEWQGTKLEIEDSAEISWRGEWKVFSETVPNIEVRIGAIYALERISQDSTRDHIRIMEILCAYIRENAQKQDLEPSTEPFFPPSPRSDIQVALDVVGRRKAELVELEHIAKFRLDLSGSDLSGANLASGKFSGALLIGCRLEAANLRSADLRGARLDASLLNFTSFWDASLLGAVLDHSVYTRTSLRQGNIMQAKETRGLSMIGANMTAIQYLRSNESHMPTFGSSDTQLAEDLQMKLEQCSEDISELDNHLHGYPIEDKEGVVQRLTKAGFLYWSPFASSDLAIHSQRNELWQKLRLTGFPYDNE